MAAHGADVLFMPRSVSRNETVGRLGDLRCGAVIALKQQHPRTAVVALEAHERIGIRGAKAVNALILVADHEYAPALTGEQADDLMLDLRGVLRFVDADILIPLAQRAENVRVPQQYLPRENKLVVVVHKPAASERLSVRIVYRRDGDAARVQLVYLPARQAHILDIRYRFLQFLYVPALWVLSAHRAENLGKYRAVVRHKIKALRAGLARVSSDYRVAHAVYRAKLQPPGVLFAEHCGEAGAHLIARGDGIGHG